MNFVKENLPKLDLIFKKEVTDKKTLNVTNFYKESPFPNYKSDDNKGIILEKAPNYILTIIIYASVMTIFSISGKADEIYLKQLIIIPIIGQMLHFYLDSQLWKFSDKHNRDNTLSYLTKIIN